jgi:uncharacterized protein involved in exopolysaccharide biosynthesis
LDGAVKTIDAGQDETSLRALFQIFWKDRWIMLGITLGLSAIVLAVALMLPRKYTATIVLSAVSSRSDSGIGSASSLLSQFGGIASLAGISAGGDAERSESIATLQSEVLTRQYIEKQNLLPVLFAERWNQATGKWKVEDPQSIPTLWQGTELFKLQVRKVAENAKSGLVTMTITWGDPKLAARWANDLVKVTNDYMRDKAIRRSERNISYLNEQAAKTDIAQVRSAIYTILESEIRSAMLARGNEEYALKVLDPAIAPEVPSSPKRRVWVAVGAFGGLFLAILVVLVRRAWART